jgi:hypothetical protein
MRTFLIFLAFVAVAAVGWSFGAVIMDRLLGN